MAVQLWTTTATTGDDFLLGGTGADALNAGPGDDYVLGDSSTPFTYGTSTVAGSPANLDSPLYWNVDENPFVGDAAIPHTTLYVATEAGKQNYASVTVGAGQTITVDVDFGQYDGIGGDANVYVQLLDSADTVVASNDRVDDYGVGGAGSVNWEDPYFTFTNSTGSAQTYTIVFSNSGVDPAFAGDQAFTANISVSGHDVSAPTSMGDDAINGGEGNDVLSGQGGDDVLNGGSGYDDLYGGSGDDTLDGGDLIDTAWYVDATSAVFVDLGQTGAQNTGGAGIDTLTNIEGIVGSNYDDVLNGGANGDKLRGGSGEDTIAGNGGNDALYGENGSDSLFGGSGDDTLTADNHDYGVWYDNSLFGEDGTDTLYGWYGDDSLYGGNGNDSITESGGNDVIDGGAGTDILYYWSGFGPVTVDLSLSTAQVTGQGTDTITGIENLLATSANDIVTGNSGSNWLSGWWGNDTLHGADGNDTLIGDTGDDVMDGGLGIDTAVYGYAGVAVTVNLGTNSAQNTGEGIDTLTKIENLIGSTYDDKLFGNSISNRLEGGSGQDTLRGNSGDDTLLGGDGNDTLLGGDGNDRLAGGTGSDTVSYAGSSAVTVDLAVTAAQDTVGSGTDTITGVENLIGTSNNDNFHGDGNANRIDGGAGADILAGRGGNDIYIVDNSADQVIEGSAAGTDRVISSVTFTLGANVERLDLGGTDSTNGVGNTLKNVITGNGSGNMLDGKDGSDTLTGGAGADKFRFDTALASSNIDHIKDFAHASDKVQLDDDVFTAIGAIGTLSIDAFFAGTHAHDASDRIIYDSATGKLFYDADGNGAGHQILFAILSTGLALTNGDFEIIG